MMGMKQFIHSYLSSLTFTYSDVLEIIILSFVVYHILIWIRNTRAWTLMKGILVMIVFIFIATLLNLDSILFLVSKGINAILVATAVIFQPELRRALEQLGEKKFLSSLLPFDMEKDAEERFSDKTVNELVKGSFEMGKAKDRCSDRSGKKHQAYRVYKNRYRAGFSGYQSAFAEYF